MSVLLSTFLYQYELGEKEKGRDQTISSSEDSSNLDRVLLVPRVVLGPDLDQLCDTGP